MSAEPVPLESPPADKFPSSSVQVQDVEPHPVADDNHELRELGYVPELKRVRSFGHIFSMTITFFAIPYGISSAFYTALVGGGPATLFWGPVFIFVTTLVVGYSVGEIASRFPTSAGPYYWTFQLAPKSFRVLLSYVTGWVFLTGIVLSSTSVAYGTALMIGGAINIHLPDYVIPTWLYLVIAYGVELAAVAPMIIIPDWVPAFDYANSVMTWLVEITLMITLLVRAKDGRRSASFAFTHYDVSFSGWGRFWTFFIGCLPPAYTNCGIGLVTAMSEEVRHPERNIPKAMIMGTPVALILSWILVLPFNFTLPDIATLINAPGGVSIALALKLIVGNDAGAIILLVGLISIGYFCAVANNLAASRLLWSFSRDHAVPGSKWWSRVSPSGNVPAAIAVSTLIQMLLMLINLGSTTAFNAFAGVAVIAFGIAYAIPVACSMFEGRKAISSAPFGNRLFGPVSNVLMIVWTCFATVLFSMPVALPVTATSMNYASVVLMFFVVFSAIWYYVYAHKVYKGPPDALIHVEGYGEK